MIYLIVSLFSDNHIFNFLSSLFIVNLRVLASLSLKIKLVSSANNIGIEEIKTICKSFKNILKRKDPKQNLEEHQY